jgi:hypothetical protein
VVRRKSFFATLECEPLVRRRFTSHAEARMAVFSYLNRPGFGGGPNR